jgi:hypothetical protein
MRPIKSLVMISSLTLVALIYVHLQVELVKLSYAIDYKEKKCKDILDRKEALGYNIANLEDPSRLESILLAKKIDISLPKRGQVFKVSKVDSRVKRKESFRTATVEKKGGGFGILEFLGFKAEAQARER